MDISMREAARLLNVSESTLSRWVSDEKLPAFIINGRYRFNRVDLLEWAGRRGLPAAGLYQAGPDDLPLAALLDGNIHYTVPGTDVKSVMEAVADRLPLPSPAEKALAAQALADREGIGSTGVGEGIALPHARSPLVFPTERPILALCFLAQAVPFGAADGKPVSIVWAFVSPTIRAHLALLAKISSALHDPRLRELLDKRRPADEILARLGELS